MHELVEENGQEAAPAQGEVLMPLISSVEHSGDGWRWWLIDSGAAVSVLSEQFKAHYKCSAERAGDGHLLCSQWVCSHHKR